MRLLLVQLWPVFGLIALAQSQSQSENGTYASLQDALASNSSLSELTNLIQPYFPQLANESGITLFAPNNAAVETFLNSSSASQISTDPNWLTALMNYHIVNYLVSDTAEYYDWSSSRQTSLTSWLNETFFFETLLTSPSYANVSGGQLLELTPWNGVVNVYSGLLTTSRVISDAITFDSGEIYIIDRFLTIPPSLSEVAIAFGLTSWLGATRALDLATTFDGYSNLQVFIPTNAAFEAVAGDLSALSTQQLTDLIRYHAYIVSDTNDDEYTAVTLQGSNITFTDANNNTFFVNNAHVVAANILTSNGFVYIIDQVLNPANTTFLNLTGCDPGAVAFANPTSSNGAPYTEGIPTPTSTINTALATYTFITSAVTACPAAKATAPSTNGSPPPDNPNTSSGNSSSTSTSGSKKNLGAIIGGVLGGVGGLLLVALLLWWCRRKGYAALSQKKEGENNDHIPRAAAFGYPTRGNTVETSQNTFTRGAGAGFGAGADVGMLSAYEKQQAETTTREHNPTYATGMAHQSERNRLPEMATLEEGRRFRSMEPSSPTAATIRDFNELEGHQHYWAPDGGPQHYGPGAGPGLEPALYGGSSGDGRGSRSGISNGTRNQYLSSGAVSSISTQPLVGDDGTHRRAMSPEMAFLRSIQTSQNTTAAPRRKPMSGNMNMNVDMGGVGGVRPVSPVHEGEYRDHVNRHMQQGSRFREI